MKSRTEEVIPEGVYITKCSNCGKIVTAYDAYFDFYDGYDGFEDNDDPQYGYYTESACFRCPHCNESSEFEVFYGQNGFDIKKDKAPPRCGFSLGSGFGLPQASGFSLPKGRFSLFNLRRHRR